MGYLGVPCRRAARLALDPGDATVYAIRATTPSVAGTFVGLQATVGSNAAVGTTTTIVLGLYSDAGGMPGSSFSKRIIASNMGFANPAALFTLPSDGGSYENSFTGALAASTTYWIYLRGYYNNEGNGPDAIISGAEHQPLPVRRLDQRRPARSVVLHPGGQRSRVPWRHRGVPHRDVPLIAPRSLVFARATTRRPRRIAATKSDATQRSTRAVRSVAAVDIESPSPAPRAT